jgi:uncharacterized protein (TIGR02246 family)
MPPTDVQSLVLEHVEAYNARDLDRTLSYYAPDAVIVDNGGTVLSDGHEAIRAAYGQVFAQNPGLHADVPMAFQVGDWVAIHTIVPDWVMRDGSRREMQWIEVFHVVGGKIQRVHLYH